MLSLSTVLSLWALPCSSFSSFFDLTYTSPSRTGRRFVVLPSRVQDLEDTSLPAVGSLSFLVGLPSTHVTT